MRLMLRRLMRVAMFFGLIYPFALSAHADSYLEDDLQLWTPVFIQGSVPLKRPLLYVLEAQPRVGNLDGQQQKGPISLLILRGAAGYQVNKNISLWQGYAWIPVFQPTALQENRIYQQVLITNKIKKLQIVNRTRLEQRFLPSTDGTSVRARHMLRLVYPISKSQKWSLVASDELFVNLNGVKNGPGAGLEQNRAFLGINRRVSKNMSLEGGYLANFVNRPDPITNGLNHAIVLNVYVNLP